jgi:hypothetical protein
MPRPATGSTEISLRSRPYSPNEQASPSAIHGGVPASKVSHATPAAAHATASHCRPRRRSLSTTTPSSTLTSGLMK